MADIDQFTIRGFEEQFEPEMANRIHDLLERITKLSLSNRISRYYASDLSLCLSAGALLGALHVASSLLEIVVREIAIKLCTDRLFDKEYKTENLQKELENKKIRFKELVERLKKIGIFEPDDAQELKDLYDTVRIPVHHGLPVRFVEKNTDFLAKQELLGNIFGVELSNAGVGFHDFEEAVEQSSLSLIETAIGLIERNSK